MILVHRGSPKDVSFCERGGVPAGGLSVSRLEQSVPVGLGSPERTPGADTHPPLPRHPRGPVFIKERGARGRARPIFGHNSDRFLPVDLLLGPFFSPALNCSGS